jgi:hypothetical protein
VFHYIDIINSSSAFEVKTPTDHETGVHVPPVVQPMTAANEVKDIDAPAAAAATGSINEVGATGSSTLTAQSPAVVEQDVVMVVSSAHASPPPIALAIVADTPVIDREPVAIQSAHPTTVAAPVIATAGDTAAADAIITSNVTAIINDIATAALESKEDQKKQPVMIDESQSYPMSTHQTFSGRQEAMAVIPIYWSHIWVNSSLLNILWMSVNKLGLTHPNVVLIGNEYKAGNGQHYVVLMLTAHIGKGSTRPSIKSRKMRVLWLDNRKIATISFPARGVTKVRRLNYGEYHSLFAQHEPELQQELGSDLTPDGESITSRSSKRRRQPSAAAVTPTRPVPLLNRKTKASISPPAASSSSSSSSSSISTASSSSSSDDESDSDNSPVIISKRRVPAKKQPAPVPTPPKARASLAAMPKKRAAAVAVMATRAPKKVAVSPAKKKMATATTITTDDHHPVHVPARPISISSSKRKLPAAIPAPIPTPIPTPTRRLPRSQTPVVVPLAIRDRDRSSIVIEQVDDINIDDDHIVPDAPTLAASAPTLARVVPSIDSNINSSLISTLIERVDAMQRQLDDDRKAKRSRQGTYSYACCSTVRISSNVCNCWYT